MIVILGLAGDGHQLLPHLRRDLLPSTASSYVTGTLKYYDHQVARVPGLGRSVIPILRYGEIKFEGLHKLQGSREAELLSSYKE